MNTCRVHFKPISLRELERERERELKATKPFPAFGQEFNLHILVQYLDLTAGGSLGPVITLPWSLK